MTGAVTAHDFAFTVPVPPGDVQLPHRSPSESPLHMFLDDCTELLNGAPPSLDMAYPD